ncbi:PilZ domain-containing protein [Dasania sp. GY-MA-18]|uniref:Cyclic diguanosine monophosphate-binding protein n=1 Tax=Dasania phycosphaerae TaxID=2950436 RepID=A0A9J6RIB9_9GAMM|nr:MULTISPECIES: PilZ domain-containing protein [Dasania]MCR8921531.1 PilZ domain-containing protein [Dasania sp. GY-MA-18]MCZ0863959.1 PilZ domain-containing protein [Dasania phycosphaerae]MCZ0867687.1 PilZ domain-containing protein [Dasania phycosphaerae]
MSSNERRSFSRIAFQAETSIQQGADLWAVELIDVSLKGLLIKKPDDWSGNRELAFHISIHLGDNTDITMTALERHDDDGQLGFECQHIDIDSIAHLRRLVELNLGDASLLERELATLGQ